MSLGLIAKKRYMLAEFFLIFFNFFGRAVATVFD